MTWGRDTPAENAHALLEMFCDAGGTLIDTAAAYGAGDAERIVGKLIRELGNRDEVVATKAGFVIRDGKRIVDTSRRALLRDLDGSLRRLQSDYIDLADPRLGQGSGRGITGRDRLRGLDRRGALRRSIELRGLANGTGGHLAAAFPGRTPVASAQVEYSCSHAEPRSRCSQLCGPSAWDSFRGHRLAAAY